MPQILDLYVTMITSVLAELGYPIGSQYRCNSVVAIYLVGNDDAYSSDVDGNEISNPWEDEVPPDLRDRTVLCLNGVDSEIQIPYTPDINKTTVIGCFFSLSALPPTGESQTVWGVDSNLHMSVNNYASSPDSVTRMSLFGVGGNKLPLGTYQANEWYSCSLAWPDTAADGVARVNQKPQMVTKGTTAPAASPLRFGWRAGGGPNRLIETLAEILIYENGILVHHYPLDADTGTVAQDIVGGLDGTIVNPTWCDNPLYVGVDKPIASGLFNPPDTVVGQVYYYNTLPLFTGGTPTAWVVNGTLPDGITFDGTTGLFGGMATRTQTVANISVKGENHGGSATTNTADIYVAPIPAPVIIGVFDPPDGNKGVSYTYDGSGLFSGVIDSYSMLGVLPDGLMFNASTVKITGVPQKGQLATGLQLVASNASASTASAVADISIEVALPVLSGVFDPPDSIQGAAYNYSITSIFTGDVDSYSQTGTLPDGIVFSTTTGIFSGSPTTEETVTGIYVSAHNYSGKTDSGTADIEIYPSAPIASGLFDPPDTNVGSPYFYDTTTLFTGGAPSSYAVNGVPPAGITFDTVTGLFGGVATTVETATGISVTGTNATGNDTTGIADIDVGQQLVPDYQLVLDGTSWMELSNEWVSTGNTKITVNFSGIIDSGVFKYLFDAASATDRCYLFINTTGQLTLPYQTTSATMDGAVFNDNDAFPNDSAEHELIINCTGDARIGFLAARYNIADVLTGIIHSVELEDLTTPSNSIAWDIDSGPPVYEYVYGPTTWPADLDGLTHSSRIASVVTTSGVSEVTSTATTGEFWMRSAAYDTDNSTYVSAEAKAGTNNYLLLRAGSATSNVYGAKFDILNGTIIGVYNGPASNEGITTASITPTGDGFYLCRIERIGSVSYPSVCMCDGVDNNSSVATLTAGETIFIKDPKRGLIDDFEVLSDGTFYQDSETYGTGPDIGVSTTIPDGGSVQIVASGEHYLGFHPTLTYTDSLATDAAFTKGAFIVGATTLNNNTGASITYTPQINSVPQGLIMENVEAADWEEVP